MVIDVTFDVRTDTPIGKDPDSESQTLRMFHKHLWSKPLPSGHQFDLQSGLKGTYLHHSSELGEFRLSSDIMVNSYVSAKRLSHIISLGPREYPSALEDLSHTVGNFIIFPQNRVGKMMTINGARGCAHKIQDRFDLTLECIRRHYCNEASPLSDALERYADFFRLFVSFEGYVDFFLLDDLVSNNGVSFFLPFDDFKTPALPQDWEEYLRYAEKASDFIASRNARVALTVDAD